jgi:hypothetical protein
LHLDSSTTSLLLKLRGTGDPVAETVTNMGSMAKLKSLVHALALSSPARHISLPASESDSFTDSLPVMERHTSVFPILPYRRHVRPPLSKAFTHRLLVTKVACTLRENVVPFELCDRRHPVGKCSAE